MTKTLQLPGYVEPSAVLLKLLSHHVEAFDVIPAKAGIQSFPAFLDPGSRLPPGQASFSRGDGVGNPVAMGRTYPGKVALSE